MIDEKDLKLLKDVLWDTDLACLDLIKNRRPIIERLMVYGRPEHIQWMLEHYSDKDLAETVRKSKNLDKKTANYWAIRLKIHL
jgi:hypothetical protein